MIAILQMGDIHIRDGRSNVVLDRADLIVAAVRTLIAPATDLYLVLTGDIAYAGKLAEYELAATFVAQIEEGLKKLGSPQFIGGIVIPGNHDCDFGKSGDLRAHAINGILSKTEMFEIDGKTALELLSAQQPFFDFLSLMSPKSDNKPKLSWKTSLDGGRRKVVFRCIDTAWISQEKEQPGQIWFPPEAVPAIDGESDLVVSLMHHPYGWMEPDNARSIRRVLETSSDLILTGHEHETESYMKTASDGTVTTFVEGSALYDPRVRENGFNVILVDVEKTSYQVAQFVWTKGIYEQISVTSGIFVRNQKLLEHYFQNTDEFRASLDEIGTPFTHREKTLKLSDLFVYPDLRVTDHLTGKPEKLVRSSNVLQFVVDSPKLRICGPPTSGRTSLAKTLYRDLLAKKKIVPVFLNGEDFHNVGYESVVGVISRSFKRQYSEKLYTRFSQLQNEERIFIIDNWQNFPLNEDGERLVLEAITKYGGRLLLISDEADIVHQIRQLAKSEFFADCVFCDIQQFGHVLRSELIRNWILLGKDFHLDEMDLTTAINNAEHLLDTLVLTGVVPSFPVFIFAALQANDQTTSNANYGSFGHIYEQLLTRRLGKYGQKEVAAKLTLLSRVAFTMRSLKRQSVTEREFEHIEQTYSREYAVPGDITEWRIQFVDSQILSLESGEVSFVYKYAYYFLLAWYFQDGISNADEAGELKQQLRQMVESTQDEANAHTLIFYLYLSKDRELIESIIAKAKSTLASLPPFDVTKDVEFANQLCTRHPNMLAPSTDHKGNRKAHNEFKDGKVEKGKGNQKNTQNGDQALDTGIGFELLNIMGQVVRNFPLDLRADLKRDLTHESYSLGLRIAKAILTVIEKHHVEIAESLRSFLQKNSVFMRRSDEDITYASNMFLVGLTEGLVLAVIKKVSFSVGVQELRETYQQVRERAGEEDTSMRMIDLAITLDHFASIPLKDVEELKQKLGSNVVGYTMLRMLVGEFLSLFPCPFRTRQRVEKLLDFKPNDPKLLLEKRVRLLPKRSS